MLTSILTSTAVLACLLVNEQYPLQDQPKPVCSVLLAKTRLLQRTVVFKDWFPLIYLFLGSWLFLANVFDIASQSRNVSIFLD